VSGRIRLLVSDIDGTLVRRDKSLSEGVIAAVGRAKAAGIAVSLISARPPSGMLWIAERLELTGVLGAFNGGTIVQPDGTVVSADQLEPECAARALALLDHPAITPWLFAGGLWYARAIDGVYVPRERRAANIDPIIRRDFAGLLAHPDKIVGVSDDHALLARLDGEIAAALGQDATVGRSQPYYLDITAPRANKGDGVAALAAAIGVPLANVAVLGDERNDLPMFARAGLSIAMGQGPDAVRAAADRVTRSNEEDGVAHAIDEIILPEAAP
jgi:Cof subfamily protein (haloacid dehalogenase superfamily)|tara:strand:- start:3212 stop:4027 length:816 start_codon:yes stop_codon:yes gene_type:complete